ncbi:hypothetical protein C900_05918 [Fulvivirga imtechensis AK7]|uniref:Uncharacterized protein n=1 Tax=Fulvivirga imtechensis AK7 TaxID=1237149 RepID=L8JIW1_9BACT|nr:hypothetical protein C900_05918 [Fulvivirga imtechensis AK7]
MDRNPLTYFKKFPDAMMPIANPHIIKIHEYEGFNEFPVLPTHLKKSRSL